MTMDMHKILEQIGWTNGFHVPVANAENQALEAELEKLAMRKSKARIIYEEANAKHDAMEKHLKYVKQESEQNQKLLTAYAQQVATERHRLKQSKAEQERLNQELRQISKHREEIRYRHEDKKNALSKALNKIEKLKAETAWDAEALKAWEESLKKRDDDTDVLKNFSKNDERKIKDLDARRQHLQLEVCEKRNIVEKMVAELRNYEQMQDRTDKLFKQQEEERKSLVVQWQDAVKNLRQRDEDIAKTNADIIQTQAIIIERQEELTEQDTFLKNERANNRKIEFEIEELNSINSRTRRELNELVSHILTLANDATTVKRNLTAVSSKLTKEQQQSKNLAKEQNLIKAKIAVASIANEELRKKLDEILSTSLSSSERTKRLEQMINSGQQLTGNLLLDAEHVQGILYRHQILLQELKDVAKSHETQISGIAVSNKHIQKQMKTKLDDVNLQKEMVYSLEYRLNEIEVKIASIEDKNKMDEETEMLNAKIADLEAIVVEHNDVKTFLQGQVNRLQDEMRRLGTIIMADIERIDTLKRKLHEQILLFGGGLKQVATAKLKAQQKQVEENVLRLRVSQLETAISKEEHNIYDLQKFKLEMELALRQRQIEIQAHKDIIQAEKKNLEESRGRLRQDIGHKKIRVDQFQKKHHLALMSLGTDEDGQPLSITHFKIKDSQERFMLQQEGDELDNKIKKAEKEIVAMENTLKVVNMTNVAYKKSLASDEEHDEEREELKNVEIELCNTAAILRKQKSLLSEKRKALKKLQENLLDIEEKHAEEHRKFEEVETRHERLKEQQPPREEKLTKTIREVQIYKRRVRARDDLEKPEKNLIIRQLQDGNKEGFHVLTLLLSEHEDLTPCVINILGNYNLEMPSVPKSRLSTSSSSMGPLTASTRSYHSNSSADSYFAPTPVVLTFHQDSEKPKGSKHK